MQLVWTLLSHICSILYSPLLFSHTLLTEPRRQFEIVFRMIDVDGSDTVDINEFTRVRYHDNSQKITLYRNLDAESSYKTATESSECFNMYSTGNHT